MIVCLISWFQFLTVDNSIYKSSKHCGCNLLVFLNLVENVFISITVFLSISSSSSPLLIRLLLTLMHLILELRSTCNVLGSFHHILTLLPLFSSFSTLFFILITFFIQKVIIYLQIQIIPLLRMIQLSLIVKNPSSSNIGNNLTRPRRLNRSVLRAPLISLKILLLN